MQETRGWKEETSQCSWEPTGHSLGQARDGNWLCCQRWCSLPVQVSLQAPTATTSQKNLPGLPTGNSLNTDNHSGSTKNSLYRERLWGSWTNQNHIRMKTKTPLARLFGTLFLLTAGGGGDGGSGGGRVQRTPGCSVPNPSCPGQCQLHGWDIVPAGPSVPKGMQRLCCVSPASRAPRSPVGCQTVLGLLKYPLRWGDFNLGMHEEAGCGARLIGSQQSGGASEACGDFVPSL